jgi:hypothetical protein
VGSKSNQIQHIFFYLSNSFFKTHSACKTFKSNLFHGLGDYMNLTCVEVPDMITKELGALSKQRGKNDHEPNWPKPKKLWCFGLM